MNKRENSKEILTAKNFVLDLLFSLRGKKADTKKFINNASQATGRSKATIRQILTDQSGQVHLKHDGQFEVDPDAFFPVAINNRPKETGRPFRIGIRRGKSTNAKYRG